MRTTVPTLYDWAGGLAALEKLTKLFYQRVPDDPLLGPVFQDMPPDHPQHVAQFIAEVFGGPALYNGGTEGHATMISHHLERHLTEQQRRHWINLLLDTADDAGLPSDPEFRSAFVAYLEWGSRLAVINSQPGMHAPPADSPMPHWGWGEVGGPYVPEESSQKA